MTSGPTGVGGLYATVKLDTTQAILALRRLDVQINKTAVNLRKLTTSGTAAAKGAGASGGGALGAFGGAAAMVAPGGRVQPSMA